MEKQEKILICGILPPPYFGHSMMYKMLMESDFIKMYDVKFLNLHFWTYTSHKKITLGKLWKMVKYLGQYIYLIVTFRPKYVLYNMSFDKMPFLKDFIFCSIGRFLGCKIVIHDFGQYVKELYDGSNSFYKKLIERFCTMATSSIVMGEGTKNFYNGLIDKSKLVVVPGCVSDFNNMFREKNESTREERDNETIEVLYFSFLSKSKGIETALNAVSEVIKKNTKIHFTFGGPFESEELKEESMSFVKEHGLENFVTFLGYVDNEKQRTQLLRIADIFIFPTHRDVFGLVLLHALAEGVAVVASIEGTIPEIIVDGQTGLLFPKGDIKQLAEKILALAQNKSLRIQLGQKGRERYLAMYTPQIYGQKMIGAFRDIEDF